MTTNNEVLDTTAPEATTDAASALPYWLGVPLLLAGPVFTARVLIANQSRAALHIPGALSIALVVMVGALWSPFGLSIPAAILQFAREAALPKMGASSSFSPMNVVRMVILTPYLAFSRTSRVRAEAACALGGWAYALVIIAPHVHGFGL